MLIEVNGEPREVGDAIKLSDLVRDLALAPERVAIELNKAVVRRTDWPATTITDGDRLEIVHFVGGGSGRSPRVSKGLREPSLTVGLLMDLDWV